MPLMPAREPQPLPAALASARLEFDELLRRRLDADRDPQWESLLYALAANFADAVDRGNDARQMLRQQPLDYVDAVVVSGDAGDLLVDAVEYEQAPVYWRSRAGFHTGQSVIRGRDLDAYLRTGEARYAEAIGLQ